MIATNTRSSRFLRYGDVRQKCPGTETVFDTLTADVLTLGSAARKNNTGRIGKAKYIGTSRLVNGVRYRSDAEPRAGDKRARQQSKSVVPSSDDADVRYSSYLPSDRGDIGLISLGSCFTTV